MSSTLDQLLVSYGFGDRVAAHFSATSALPARVIRVDRDRVGAISAGGEVVVGAHPLPAVGDWIGIEPSGHADVPWTATFTVTRWSEMTRLDPTSFSHGHDTAQVLAANIDLVLVTAPLDRPLSQRRIEREIVVAWDAGARPIVVLTKADRHEAPDAAADDLRDRLLGTDVIVTAAVDGRGVDAVARELQPNRTALLLGASGAGKSTLTNALLGSEAMETGGVRRLDSRGRHTTTARHLLAVPSGGVLIDSPGIRSVGLAGGDDGMSLAFSDIDDLATHCRFDDCAHDREPGCAVHAAIDDGSLDADRFKNWSKLQRELAAHERRGDPKAQALHREAMRKFNKAIRQHAKRARP